MPNYAIINFKNLCSIESIRNVQREANRGKNYSNVDSERSHQNEYLIGDGNYTRMINQALQSEYYLKLDSKGRPHEQPRIKAIGIVMTYSPEAAIEEDPEAFERWKQKNIEYLKKTFPGCPLSVILHRDETTPHIHAFVIPQLENGKIVKTKFLNGMKDYYKHQREYPKAMEEFGLVRGEHRPPRQADLFEENEMKEYRKIVNRVKKLEKKVATLEGKVAEKEEYIQTLTREAEVRQGTIEAYKREKERLESKVAELQEIIQDKQHERYLYKLEELGIKQPEFKNETEKIKENTYGRE